MYNYPYNDQFRREAMADLSELLLVAAPVQMMQKPREHYLDEMRTYSNDSEVGRRLAAVKGPAAWPLLLGLRDKVVGGRREFEADLINALTSEHVPEFLSLIGDGSIFRWADRGSNIIRPTRAKASMIQSTVGAEAFANACKRAQRAGADQLAAAVLSDMTGTEEIRAAYGLEVIEAGRQEPSEFGSGMLRSLFYLQVPLGRSAYEVRPQARNSLRMQIYNRAKRAAVVGSPYRELLAGLERSRRESGRPDAENRHPDRSDGLCWTDVLAG